MKANKLCKLILAAFCLFFICSDSKAQNWSVKPVINAAVNFNGVHFTSDQTGYTVGTGGAIYITQDGGLAWSAQSSNTTNALHAVFFINSGIGYAVGANGTIRKTINGGSTWTTQTNPSGTSATTFYGVHFPDPATPGTGYIVGSGGSIIKTTNGGTTWTNLTSGTTNDLQAVYFTTTSIGYAVGLGGTLRKTSNGGTSWAQLTISTIQNINDVQFLDASTGYVAGGNGEVWKTTDAGTIWTLKNSGLGSLENFNMHFSSASNGYVVTGSSYYYLTVDGAANWIFNTLVGAGGTINDMHFSSVYSGYMVGNNGTFVKYQSELEPEYQATNMIFTEVYSNSMRVNYTSSVDLPTGYLVLMKAGSNPTTDPQDGTSYTLNQILPDGSVVAYVGSSTSFGLSSLSTNTGYYFKVHAYNGSGQATNYKVSTPLSGNQSTYINGTPWNSLTNSTYWYPRDVHFFDANIGGVGGGYSLVTSNDGGQNLTFGGSNGDSYDGIFFTNATTGYVVGGNGASTRVIMRTVNGGVTWVDQVRTIGTVLSDVWFTNSITGFAVGRGGSILRTTNGISWSSISSSTLNDLSSVHFPTPAVGYSVGQSGTIIKSTNGGASWSLLTSPTTNQLHSVYFTDANTGYIAGDLGILYKTSNGGSSWTALVSGTINELYEIQFVNASTGYTVGRNGTILKTIDAGANWYSFNTGVDLVANYWGVHFPTVHTGYAVGDNGINTIIYKFQSAPEPTSQPAGIAFSSILAHTATVSYSAASGSPIGYIVLRKELAAPNSTPLDGVEYVDGNTIGDATVVYVGPNLTFDESGLNASTNYHYAVYAYNNNGGEAGSTNYRLSSPLNGNFYSLASKPSAQPTAVIFSNITSSSLTASYTAAAGSPTGYIAVRKTGSAPTSNPADGTPYTIGQALGDGTVAYVGSALSFNDTGLGGGNHYYYKIYSYNGTGLSTNYATGSPLSDDIDFGIPSITSFTPSSGLIGSSIVLTGTNFSATPANNIVYFGAIKATVTAATATQLTVTVPVGATYQPISVTLATSGLTASSKNPFIVTFPSSGVGFSVNSFTTDNQQFGTEDTPNNVALGDIDGDGKTDMVVVSTNNNTVSVFRNTSTPETAASFASPRTDLSTGLSFPYGLAVGDLDGDGLLDIAVTNISANTFSVFRNTSTTGTVSFASKTDYATNQIPLGIVIGELSNDGRPDIAVANYNGLNVSVFPNTSTPGNISFGTKTDFSNGTAFHTPAIADIDGDGKNDLAVTNNLNAQVSVFRNTSTSTISFAASVNFTTGNNPENIAFGDLDGDAKPDMAIGNFNSETLSIFRNTATSGVINISSFATKQDLPTGFGPVNVAIADLDGDGKPDVATANAQVLSNTISLFRNTSVSGTITLQPKVDIETGTSPSGLAIGDIDGDKKPDLAVVSENGNFAYIHRNLVAGPVITSFSPTSGPVGTEVTILGSGFSSVAASNTVYFGAVKATPTSSTTTSITLNVPAGATYQPMSVTLNGLTAYSAQPFITKFTSSLALDGNSFTTPVDKTSGTNPFGMAIGDFDGDGKTDYVVANNADNTISIFRNTTSAGIISYATAVNRTTATSPYGVAVADLDGDGKLDIAVTSSNSSVVSLFRNSSNPGSITFSTKVDLTTASNAFGVAIHDLDSDGKPEIAVACFNNKISVFRNISTSGGITIGSFDAKVDLTSGSAPVSIALGDLNADGKPDIVTTNSSANTISVLRNTSITGLLNFAAKTDYSTGATSAPNWVSIGDLNSDGKPDVVTANNNSHKVSVFKNTTLSSASITLETRVDFTTDTGPYCVVIGDLDGDGKPDLATANVSNASASLFRNTSTSGSISFATKYDVAGIGTQPRVTAIGDMDNDGKPDLVVASGSSNKVSTIRNINTLPAPVPAAGNPIGQTSFTANWASVAAAEDYRMDVSADNFFSMLINYNGLTTSGSSLAVTGLSPGTTYKYRLRSSNSTGISDNSTSVTVLTLPATPTANAATSLMQTSFTANWSAAPGAVSYKLDVSSISDFTAGNVLSDFSVAGTSSSLTVLATGTTYYYRVRATNLTGSSPNSSTISAITVPVAPTANAATSISTTAFTANWSPTLGASSYQFDVATNAAFTVGLSSSVIPSSATSVNLSSLTPGTTYYYRLRAANVSGTSGNSNTISTITIPVAPTANAASIITASGFTANWASATGATQYNLDISTDNSFSSILSQPTSTGTSVIVNGLSPGTNYYYRVRASNGSGSSANSGTITVLTWPAPPVANEALSITSTTFTASWAPVPTATGYFIDVSTEVNNFSPNVTGYNNASVGSTSITVTLPTTGIKYIYRVRAVNASVPIGTSSNSNTVTTLLKPTPPVAGAASAVTADSFTANWDNTPGIDYYLDVSSNNFSTFLSGFDNANIDSPPVNVTGLTAGINYQYRVRSYNATGSSANSAIITTVTIPPAPVAISASSFTATSFTANWQATTGASSYKLDVSSDPAFGTFFSTFNNLTVSGTSSSVSGLTPGTVYYYQVRAVNASGTSPNSNAISSTNIPPPPSVASATSISTTSFNANWSTTSGALSYLLDVSDNNFSSFVSGYDDLSVTGNSQSITGLTAGTAYQYRVRATNASGTSSNSSTISVQTLPAEPITQATAMNFTSITISSMNVSYIAASGGPAGYLIIRKTASSPTGLPIDGVTYSSGSSIGDGTVAYVGSATTFSESNLSPGIGYFYDVYAYNGSSISTNYNTNSPLEGSTVTLPDAPVALTATLIGQTLFNANWISASGATGYFIDVSTDDFSTYLTGYNNQPTGNITSIGVSSLAAASTYQYRIRSVNASGSSINSNSISVLTIPPTPTALSAAGASTTGFTANWSGSGTTNFFIDVSSDNFSTFVTGYNNLAVDGSFSQNITGLNTGTTYKYRIRSSNASGVSPSSSAISATTLVSEPTAQPTTLTFSSVTINSFDLSFTAALGSPAGYLVLRKAGSAPLEVPADGIVYSVGGSIGSSTVVNIGSTSFSEVSLNNETNYFYSIYSYNGAGTSINYLVTTPLQGTKSTLAVEPISQPTLFSFAPGIAGLYSLSFAPAAASGYLILRKQGSASTEIPTDGVSYLVGGTLGSSTVANYTSASLFDETLLSNSTYFYTVFSFNGSGASVNYRAVSPLVSSLLTVPDAPIAKPSSNNTTTSFDANWDAVSGTGAVTYQVEISKDDFLTIAQSLPLLSVTTVRINNLSPSTDYKYRVRAKNASGLSTNSVAIAARTSDVSLANVLKINTNATSTTLSVGFNQATLAVNVSGGTGTRSVVVKYRAILGGAYASLVAVDKGSDNFEAILAESKVDELGLEYYFEATDELGTLVKSSGNSFIYLSKSSAVVEAIPFTSNFDGTSGTFEMFSVPYVLTDKNISGIFDELGAPDKTQWRLFHFKGNKYIEYPDNITTLELGKGYWFNAKEKIEIKPGAGELSKANQNTPFQIAFEKGWNQIGNPYPFNIDWNVIKNANQVAGLNGLWLFEKGVYAKKDVLATWKGAFVFSDNGGTVNFPVSSKTSAAGRVTANELFPKIDEDAWQLPLTLSLNGMDQISSIGMHQDANASKDGFDEITMPRFIDYLEMDTYHKEFFAHNFSSDIVPTTSTANWVFTVSSSQKGNEATIAWDQQALFNSHAKIALLDLQTQELVDMKTTSSYRFSWTEGRQFKILYTKEGELLPGITLLGNAYPNPFNAAVTIPFMLEQDQSNVEVVVYDMLGRKIKSIGKADVKAGIHNLEWNGGNEQGDAVESGMYFYQLRGDKGILSSIKRLLKQ